jgi:hypothetical protein
VLVTKAQGADALPLLAFTLQRMFDLYHKEQRLTAADYEEMGGTPFPSSSGSRAMLTAIRRASSAVSTFACRASDLSARHPARPTASCAGGALIEDATAS